MIEFLNESNSAPYTKLREIYCKALEYNQQSIEAIAISSFNKQNDEVNSRFVNLKFIDNENFIFFTNYNSTKSIEFESHSQISAIFFWSQINTQIRIKASIRKTSRSFNENYFKNRSIEKNALAISSNQSNPIHSFEQVEENYKKALYSENLYRCPKYWGGYSFLPYEIEFWEGNKFRLNKRDLFKKNNTTWAHCILEP